MRGCRVSGSSSSSLRRPSAADGDARSRVSSSGCVPGRWIFSGFIICGLCQRLCAKEMLMIRGYAGFVGGDGRQASGRRQCPLEGSSSTGSMNFSVFFVLLRGLSAKWSGQVSCSYVPVFVRFSLTRNIDAYYQKKSETVSERETFTVTVDFCGEPNAFPRAGVTRKPISESSGA